MNMAKKVLTAPMEVYVQELLKGKSQKQAYLIAYPKRSHWSPKCLDTEASALFRRPLVRERYDQLLKEFQEKESVKTGWTRELAIENLRFVIDTNRKDLERIQQAAEEELELLQKQIEKNPENAPNLIRLLLLSKRTKRANTTNNDGIIKATAELNKMHGYNEENINMNGTVMFVDEDNLEE